MNLQPMRRQVDRLRSIPLPTVLLAAGAEPDRDDKARWHTATGIISITGCKFYNWNRGCGGGGAIDLVLHIYDTNFKGAVAWLSGRFPHATPAQPSSGTTTTSLKLPMPHAATLSTVKHYLIAQRGITPAILKRLIQAGNLYADNHANAVFLLLGKEKRPVGAELRGTGPYPWRGMVPGSRKNLGYFSIAPAYPKGIILCESAIDAISCFIIHSQHCCISSAGTRPNPSWLPNLIRRSPQIYCGFDADQTGDNMAYAMIHRYPSVKRLRPSQHDWNDVLRTYP